MKPSTAFITGIAAAAITLGGIVAIAPASSAAVCNDGSFSMSSGRGTCSWHGGVMGGGSSRNYGGYDSFGNGSRYSDPFASGGSKRGGNSYGLGSGSNSFDLGSGSNSFGRGSGSNSFDFGSGSNSYGLGSGSNSYGLGSSGGSYSSKRYGW